MKPRFLYLVMIASLLWTCKKLPIASERQFTISAEVNWEADSVSLTLINPVKCPLKMTLGHEEPTIDSLLEEQNPLILEALEEKTVSVPYSGWKEEMGQEFRISSSLGSVDYFSPDSSVQYAFPFPSGREYEVIQGYNGSFSHDSDFSRYAIDFNLQPGDTVCAARDGVVVGIIEGYNIGGNNRKYRPYANFLSVYHEDGVITQYVHLLQNGVLVELGDSVKSGQPIGLCGVTGFTASPHLHFNVIRPTEGSSVSMPVNFTTGPGEELKRGMKVRN